MDPDATLQRIRELIAEQRDNEYVWELAEHIEALDAWLHRGGYLPVRWAPSAGSRFSR